MCCVRVSESAVLLRLRLVQPAVRGAAARGLLLRTPHSHRERQQEQGVVRKQGKQCPKTIHTDNTSVLIAHVSGFIFYDIDV